MRRFKFYLIGLIIIVSVSCENNDAASPTDLVEGTYKGAFIRTSPTSRYAPSYVTVTFAANRFTGGSERIKQPAICSGTYKITGQEIEFVNECQWTADFDWSFILHGKFRIELEGENVILVHTVSEQVKDVYILTKQ